MGIDKRSRAAVVTASPLLSLRLELASLAKPRLHTRLDNCLYASCAALHEIVQPNQIADRGNVTYAHIPPPTLASPVYTVIQCVHGTQGVTGPR